MLNCAEGARRRRARNEVAYDWHKSGYSDSSGGDCVEVATTPTTVHIRDSKNPDGPRLRTAATAWADFLAFATR
ncbi:DUF397 domain-containing protein [Streptomyces antimycoticus]|uniref:DUF397 domain-containing protein n=1 Tax=Streptomyces antimycoticus TaxID=68175 RepID=UPI002570B44A|nr:DUF397 domain-containing protein [Streptomyces antimycoticus]WJD96425.1 DUF397 domain-containing protein [Streptomyces antimycoticus]